MTEQTYSEDGTLTIEPADPVTPDYGHANGGHIQPGADADHPPAWLTRCLYE